MTQQTTLDPAGLEPPPAPKKRTERGMMSSSFRILRVRGISIGAHWSWLFVFGLITYSLAAELFPRTYPELTHTSYLLMGVTAASIFFASIVLHELGHAFRALKEGMKVGDITLWLFGGVARFEGMFPSAGAEFRVAIAGPVVSLLLAIAFGAVAWIGGLLDMPGQIRGVAEYLARINGAVLAFNLVPALPLDGGRVLRSWLWKKQRSFTAATMSAAKAGKAFAYLLVTIGIMGFFTEAVTGGVWMVFLGFFILQAAEAEVQYALVSRAFQPYRVKDLMTPNPVVVSPDTSVTELLDIAGARRFSTYPVCEGTALQGIVSVRAVNGMSMEDRNSKLVAEFMRPLDEVPVVSSETPMMEALVALRQFQELGRAVVVDRGEVVGVLAMSDVAKSLQLDQARGHETEGGVRRTGATVWVIVAVLMAMAAAAFYKPPLAVISPAPAINIGDDISIKGIDAQELSGEYLLLAVRLDQPNLLGVLLAMVSPSSDVIPLSSVTPDGVSNGDYVRQQESLFAESQMLAAAAAAEAVGMQVDLSGDGVRVVGVLPGSPAAKALKEDDVVVAADGETVSLATDLRRIISGRPPGTAFDLTVERAGVDRQVQVKSAQLDPQSQTPPGIGILIETRNLDVNLPFEIEFKERNVGGPSAGLAYSLAIADMLDSRDYAKNRTIAASGTVSVDGTVGPVGGLAQKSQAAQQAGADILLVPQEEVSSIPAGDLPLNGVETVEDAIAALRPATA